MIPDCMQSYQSGVPLPREAEPGAKKICADVHRVEQILLSPLSNALTFTGIGELKVVRSHSGKFCCRERDGHRDRDPAGGLRGTLFRPFSRVTDNKARPREGTGPGLSISKMLVSMMSGTIMVESEGKKGSTFRFCLPVESGM